MKIPKEKWVWMPHAAHFICGNDCRFHVATKVGKYIISTVGELWQDYRVRQIYAEVRDPQWIKENSHLKGDYWDNAYYKKFGFEDLGLGRTYETMVFPAVKDTKHKCCGFRINAGKMVDMNGYKSADDAMAGHLKLCLKYAKKQ